MAADAVTAEDPPLPRRLMSFEGRAMGSPLRLSVSVEAEPAARAVRIDAADAADVWAAVRDEFEASEAAMSRFRDDSEVTRLNRAAGVGSAIRVSARLRRALFASDRAYRLTAGRFDPRVLRDLERLGDPGAPIGAHPGLGVDDPIRAGRARMVERQPDGRIRLSAPVDLGGIGKGLALRWAGATAQRLGTTAFLLDAGGDIVATGGAPEGGPWRVGLQDPTGGSAPLAVVAVADGAIATSSVRLRHWTHGEREVHHLIDPRTGEPGGAGLLAVTVAGPDPAWAEVWSKTLFLEGRAGIPALARRLGLAAWWVTDDGSLEMTAPARVRTIWVAAEDTGQHRLRTRT